MTVDRLCVRTRYARRWLRRRHDRLAPCQRQRIALAALLLSPPPICGCCCGASYPEYQIPMKMKEPKDEIRSRRRPKVNVLLVAAALLVPFTLFMWRIFGTKETPQQEGAAGINFPCRRAASNRSKAPSKRSWRRSDRGVAGPAAAHARRGVLLAAGRLHGATSVPAEPHAGGR